MNNNEIGPEVGNYIANCLKMNNNLETLDLRWNRLGNQGAKAILKGLNLNRTLSILELSGNRVSDEVLRSINELLVRNKNGDPIACSTHSKHFYLHSKSIKETLVFNEERVPPLLEPIDDDKDFLFERQQIEERRLDVARELEEESRKRRDA